MAYCFVAEIKEIKDTEKYSRYMQQAKTIIDNHGGKYIINTLEIIPLEGNWNPEKLIVIEFESLDKLKECFNCKEYQALLPIRQAAVVGKAMAVKSFQ